MSTRQNLPEYSGTITKFLPAMLKENKSGWIIEYYCEHPVTQILTRKQIKHVYSHFGVVFQTYRYQK